MCANLHLFGLLDFFNLECLCESLEAPLMYQVFTKLEYSYHLT